MTRHLLLQRRRFYLKGGVTSSDCAEKELSSNNFIGVRKYVAQVPGLVSYRVTGLAARPIRGSGAVIGQNQTIMKTALGMSFIWEDCLCLIPAVGTVWTLRSCPLLNQCQNRKRNVWQW